mgnify:CR=1 FL=1
MQNHKGNTQPAIDQEEHSTIGGVDGKKVFVIDNAGNQITSFGSATIATLAYSFYSQTSLISGYNFYGLTVPGSNPTQSAFRIQRETINTGEVLFADGAATFSSIWSSASLASISYS